MGALLRGIGNPSSEPQQPPLPIPDGAQFRSVIHTCAAGRRHYRTYVPASAAGGIAGVVVMLHGCTQTAEDFAAGTGMNELAELHRLVMIYPQQSRGDNAQSCWCWFNPEDQQRGRGEPEIIAGIARQVCTEFTVTGENCFVAGLSAGGAMAAILGRTYPDVFAAVGVHSGLPHGAARDVGSAFAAMAGRGETLPPAVSHCPAHARHQRWILFHGTQDATVHPSNADALERQALDGVSQTIESDGRGVAGGRSYRLHIATSTNGERVLESWRIEGLAHAWSGGRPNGSYTDPQGPDASAEMLRFFLGEGEV
ncbi:PHB depolymerase family esterase [uncultured Paracoccus sp.]|uniref:extracellular catalytic domain type 1 short-chain-length polyhydroxyalkanoate depolymerase n=1 Tax=Paracoccus sp. S1E-3 TaxID=2756130 RepID=UPI00344E8D5D